jgi:hypothetical protein
VASGGVAAAPAPLPAARASLCSSAVSRTPCRMCCRPAVRSSWIIEWHSRQDPTSSIANSPYQSPPGPIRKCRVAQQQCGLDNIHTNHTHTGQHVYYLDTCARHTPAFISSSAAQTTGQTIHTLGNRQTTHTLGNRHTIHTLGNRQTIHQCARHRHAYQEGGGVQAKVAEQVVAERAPEPMEDELLAACTRRTAEKTE